jgi:hypothetical protein
MLKPVVLIYVFSEGCQRSSVIGDFIPKDPPITKKQGQPREMRYRGIQLRSSKQNLCGCCNDAAHITMDCPAKPQKDLVYEHFSVYD